MNLRLSLFGSSTWQWTLLVGSNSNIGELNHSNRGFFNQKKKEMEDLNRDDVAELG